MRVTILGPNLPVAGTEAIHVHKAGCQDTRKRLYAGQRGGWTIEAPSIQSVVFDIYPPEDFCYSEAEWEHYAADIRFFPCTDGLPEE